MTRGLWVLLGVVGVCAATLSFSSLMALALLVGFAAWSAWLYPVVIDAAAAAGAIGWLGGRVPERARRFARLLTVALLAASVAGNGVFHYLTTYRLPPAWWLVVTVSAVPAATLGAVVHLGVLVAARQPDASTETTDLATPPAAPATDQETTSGATTPTLVDRIAALQKEHDKPLGRPRLAKLLNESEHAVRRALESTNGHPRS